MLNIFKFMNKTHFSFKKPNKLNVIQQKSLLQCFFLFHLTVYFSQSLGLILDSKVSVDYSTESSRLLL
jgi:hypothetical protein